MLRAINIDMHARYACKAGNRIRDCAMHFNFPISGHGCVRQLKFDQLAWHAVQVLIFRVYLLLHPSRCSSVVNSLYYLLKENKLCAFISSLRLYIDVCEKTTDVATAHIHHPTSKHAVTTTVHG